MSTKTFIEVIEEDEDSGAQRKVRWPVARKIYSRIRTCFGEKIRGHCPCCGAPINEDAAYSGNDGIDLDE